MKAIDYQQHQTEEDISKSTEVHIDEAVTIPHPFVNRTIFNHSKVEMMNDPCNDWVWTECDHSCHQSRIASSSIIAHSNGQYCIESERETRSCHIDSCGRSNPCLVPFLVHAIFILENNSRSTSSPAWNRQMEETFRRRLVSAAHHSDIYRVGTKHTEERLLFGEGDIDILVVHPWYGDEEESSHSNTTSHNTGPLGIQLILQISITNTNANPVQSKTLGSGRSLLQEVGVAWSNFPSVFLGGDSSSVCDPFDLYPLAKTANLVADEILVNTTFLSLIMAENVSSSGVDGAQWDSKAFEGFESARLVSSWTIGTQIYDDSVNYAGPLGSTSLYPFVKFLHKAFFFISALLICKFVLLLLKSIRLCRVWGIRLKKKWFPHQSKTVDKPSKNIGNNRDSNIFGDSNSEVELAATYLRSKATKRTISANMSSPHEVA